MKRRSAALLTLGVAMAFQGFFTVPAHGEPSRRCFGKKPTIVGTQGRDILRGTPRADVIAGLDGDDRIRGRGGKDRLCGDGKYDTLIGGRGRDRIAGNAGPDHLRGGDGGDVLRAGSGFFHSLVPGGGNDRVRGARSQQDTVDYFNSPRGVKVKLRAGRASGYGFDRLSGVENAYGSKFDDVLRGNGLSNLLVGRRGDDTILGLANPTSQFGEPVELLSLDRLIGGPGSDALDGGANLDIGVYSKANRGITVDLLAGTARGQGRDALVSIEAVDGTRLADSLTGDSRSNLFQGRAGSDTISAEGGRDIVAYLSARRGVRVNLELGVSSGHGADRLNGVEDVYGSSHRDRITGDNGANRVWALEGNDTLFGLAGDDFLRGRAGRDSIDGGLGNDSCIGEAETNCEGNAS